ncbi:hypothetical protein AC791_13490 [Klebsiella sp. RIT-PI-d]|uniref:hypothetical protein n=1 Tax=Klebsiella sp. RIT-PI-d TaxID=1681196 RepID=UPI00067625B5|nr:hypothetical protein [Klebsiella sp. RIT-PI-d]KNC09645.1 hypothetical protein AC791_13490 [Klebsiella sp. RIT-PI-d]
MINAIISGGTMTKKSARISLIILMMVSTIGCKSPDTAKGLEYRAGNRVFSLKKECLVQASSRNPVSPVVFFKVKRSDTCSEKFNDLFLDNLNNKLTVLFNGDVILESRIVSPIKTEGGFYQSAPTQNEALKIAQFYK